MSGQFPCIELSGGPFARGVQYGKACPQIIARSIEIYGQQLLDMGYDWAGIKRLVNQFIPNIEAFEPQYLEEMRGIAEGSGHDFEAIVLINARTEIIHLGRRSMQDKPELDGCTGAIILPAPPRTMKCCMARTGTGAWSARRLAWSCIFVVTMARIC